MLTASDPNSSHILDKAYDPAFVSIGVGEFDPMVEVGRFSAETTLPDSLGGDHRHYWSPHDPKYLDFSQASKFEEELLVPEAVPYFHAPSVSAALNTAALRKRFISQIVWFRFSTLLHGEQGGINLGASLCSLLHDRAAQEFAAHQTSEEARHVAAFAAYIKAMWGRPAPCPHSLRGFIGELVRTEDVTRKIIGLQVMVEGLAMGSMACLYQALTEPVGKRLLQFVMADESIHLRFGRFWIKQHMSKLNDAERDRLETWTSHCVDSFILKMNPPLELQLLHREFGLNPLVVARETAELEGDQLRQSGKFGGPQVFYTLTKTLIEAQLLSPSAEARYRRFITTEVAADEQGHHDSIVASGLRHLEAINDAASR